MATAQMPCRVTCRRSDLPVAELVEWLDDGTPGGSPYSPRFKDRYRSEPGGVEQSREVFFRGCGLPGAWQSAPAWCVLETGFGLGLNFLVTWQGWKTDPLRPHLLHYVAMEAYPASAADIVRSASDHPELLPLAEQLQLQIWGLLPGFHRLVFEGGRVLLTLCIGDAKAMLRQQDFTADSVYLDGFSPQNNPDIWDIHTLKAVARCCRRGSQVASWTVARVVRDALMQAGFVVGKTAGVAPKRVKLQGQYDPAWLPKKSLGAAVYCAPRAASNCIVIGAGLAGAAVAASLAMRGWQVVVLDAADKPAAGASALPAGLMAPHVSRDDAFQSKLSRAGIRITLQQAYKMLLAGQDWALTGVAQHQLANDGPPACLPAAWLRDWPEALADWAVEADAEHIAAARLPASARALWFAHAGWIKPSALVRAWLAKPGIECRTNSSVRRLVGNAVHGWQAIDDSGHVIAQSRLVVVAAAHASNSLLKPISSGAPDCFPKLSLQPIRGQVSWGPGHDQIQLGPQFPVSGHGSFIPEVPIDGSRAWFSGASYERDVATPSVKEADHLHNFSRLQALLPLLAAELEGDFTGQRVQAWSGVRCATPNRLPVLGQLASTEAGEVWISSGMGSRGLTMAGLCGELLAAQLHREPLPVEQRLVAALRTW